METIGLGFVIVIIICMILGFDFAPILGIIIAVLVGLLILWFIFSVSERIDPEGEKAGCSLLVAVVIIVIVFFIIMNLANSTSCTLYDVCVSIF